MLSLVAARYTFCGKTLQKFVQLQLQNIFMAKALADRFLRQSLRAQRQSVSSASSALHSKQNSLEALDLKRFTGLLSSPRSTQSFFALTMLVWLSSWILNP